jgi:phosphate transport system substrate-binding protein
MKFSKKAVASLIAAAVLAGTGGIVAHAAGQSISGSGSTFIKNLFEACIPDHNSASGDTVSYTGGGSGAGRTAFAAGTVDFAGADSAYTSGAPADLTYVPLIAGPIAIAYKNSSISGTLQLSPITLAKIFAGSITTWNHADIKADNPGKSLPSGNILVVYRSDSSGTSWGFTSYLKAAAGTIWTKDGNSTFTTSTPSGAPAGAFGASGSDGVSNKVATTEGSITYVELSYQKEKSSSGVKAASIKNALGAYVAPSSAASAAAVRSIPNANINRTTGWVTPDFRTRASGAYPITILSFGLGHKTNTVKNKAVKAFFRYVLDTCAKNKAANLGYAALDGATLTFARGRADLVGNT